MKNTRAPRQFSDQLEDWLKGKQPKNFATLIQISEDKSFAILFLLLMILPALPLPTGGITHVFEIITMLLALELIVGRQTIWLPRRWCNMKLGTFLEGKAIPVLLKRVRQIERHARRRWQVVFSLPLMPRFIGLAVLVFALTAFLAPPFSGLDTFPSLAVVLVSLAIILDDAVLLLVGLVLGVASIFVVWLLGDAAVHFFHHLLK